MQSGSFPAARLAAALAMDVEAPPPETPSEVTARACGGCTACCRVFSIPELQKPRGIWCRHVAQGKGCSIYEERPEVCRAFTCAWLDGFGTDEERPDRSRIVFVQCEAPFGKVLAMYETIEGALDNRPLVARETEAALKVDLFVLQVPLGRPPRLHVPHSRATPGNRLTDEDYQAVRDIIGAFHTSVGKGAT